MTPKTMHYCNLLLQNKNRKTHKWFRTHVLLPYISFLSILAIFSTSILQPTLSLVRPLTLTTTFSLQVNKLFVVSRSSGVKVRVSSPISSGLQSPTHMKPRMLKLIHTPPIRARDTQAPQRIIPAAGNTSFKVSASLSVNTISLTKTRPPVALQTMTVGTETGF